MIKEILTYIKMLFTGESIENYKHKSQSNSHNHKYSSKETPREKKIIKKLEKSKKRSIQSTQYTYKLLNKDQLIHKIKTNILFLDSLMDTLYGKYKYHHYYIKVREMKKQSENCFKVIHRADEFASYYPSTAKAILRHTNTVSKLLDVK